MALVFEEKSKRTVYVTYCPKCGLLVPDAEDPCPWCKYSEETYLTPEEAREFTMAAD